MYKKPYPTTTISKNRIIAIFIFCSLGAITTLLIAFSQFPTTIKGTTFQEALAQAETREITFRFSENVVGFSSYEDTIQQWTDLMKLSFFPKIEGSIRTISGNKFSYIIQSPLDNTQDLVISYNTNVTSLTGSPVTLNINYQDSPSSPFTLRGKKFQINYASRPQKDLQSAIFISTALPIELSSLKKAITLSNQQNKLRFRIQYRIMTNRLDNKRFRIQTNYQSISILPYRLTKETDYTLTVDYQKIDLRSSLSPFTYSFSTYSSSQWEGLSDQSYKKTTPLTVDTDTVQTLSINKDLWLLHNNRLQIPLTTDSTLSITPEVPNINYEITRRGIQIKGDFSSGIEYFLSFTPQKLKDIYNQQITNNYKTNFILSNQQPQLKQVQKILFIDREKPTVPFQTINVTNITITYQLINSAYYTALALYGRTVPVNTYKTNFTIDAPLNKVTWHGFDLQQILSNKTMLVLMNIQDTDNPTKNTNFTKVVATTSGLTAHVSISDLLIQARDMNTLEPHENMMISIWDSVRGSFQDLGRTKSDGILRVPQHRLPLKALEKPIFIGLFEDRKKFNSIGFLSGETSSFNGINNSVSFYSSPLLLYNDITTPQHINGIIFTDRPNYQPKEKVRIHAIARAKTNSVYTSSNTFFTQSARITVLDPASQPITNIYARWSDIGSIDLSLSEKQTQNSGLYTIQIQNTSKDFFAQTFFEVYPLVPKESQIKLSSLKKNYISGEKLDVSLQPQFLFGENIASTINYTILGTPFTFQSINYPNHHFGIVDIISPYYYRNILLLKGKGKTSLQQPYITINKILTVTNNMHLSIEAQATSDSTLKIFLEDKTLSLYPPIQLGIYLKTTMVQQQEEMNFNIVALDPLTEKTISDHNTVFTIIKKEELQLGALSFITNIIPLNTTYDKVVYRKNLKSGQIDIPFTPDREGVYEAKIQAYTNKTKIISSLSFIVLGKNNDSPFHQNSHLPLELDKSEYKSRETAFLTINNPFPKAQLLLTIEKDTIREFYFINTTNTTITHTIALTPQDEPGINISAVLFAISNTNDIPSILYGSASLKIEALGKELMFVLQTIQSNYAPKDTVEITLSAKNARNQQIDGEAVVIIRDKAVLDLTKDSIPNPIESFYKERAPSFTTWDSGKMLLDIKDITNMNNNNPSPLARAIYQDSSPKGLARINLEEQSSTSSVRSNFPYTVYYNGKIKLFKNQQSVISFPLPDNITEFDITVLAYDKDQLFGKTNYSFTSSKQLIIDNILPSFVRPNDIITWGAYIRNFSDQNITTQVTLDNSDSFKKETHIIPAKSYVLVTNISTINNTNRNWMITALSETYQDSFLKNIPLIIDNPWVYSSYSGVLDSSTNIILMTPATNTLQQMLSLQLSSTPTLQIKKELNDLLNSPSLYLKTIVRRLLLFLGNEDTIIDNKLITLNKIELQAKLQQDLDSLASYYKNATIISITPRSTVTSPNPLLILHVYESLVLASQNNYQIDIDLLKQLTTTALQLSKNYQGANLNAVIAQAYALKLLASNKLLDRETFKNIYPRLSPNTHVQALILDTMYILGFSLKEISKQTLTLIKNTTETGSTIVLNNNTLPFFSSTLTSYYGTYQDGVKILNGLDVKKGNDLFAFVKFLKKYPNTVKYSITAFINNQEFILSDTNSAISIPITGDNINIKLNQEQNHIFYYIGYGYIPRDPIPFLDSGYTITKNFYDLENEQKITSYTFTRGKQYIVELEITPTTSLANQHIEIIDPLYGGMIFEFDDQQRKLLNSFSPVINTDKIYFYTRITKKPIKIRYIITADTYGIWTAPPTSVHLINSPDVFGYQKQEKITID